MIENLGTFFGLISAFTIAAFTTSAPFVWVYIFFTLASIFLIIAAYKRNSAPVIILNGGYFFINILGLYKALGV